MNELFRAWEDAWPFIDGGIMKGLIESMPRRIQTCVDADEWYNKYESSLVNQLYDF
jgi:hypothetical protein